MRVRYKGVNLWESFILLLSIYVIIELGYEVIYPLSDAAIWWVNAIDLVICAIFIGDFFYFLYHSDNRKAYFKRYWVDLLASIPFMTFFRAFRLVRAVRIIRMLRGIKALIPIIRRIGMSRTQNILISYVIILTIVMMYCSLAFYSFEKGVNPNVNEFFDAIWWAFISITSVGYGDIYPLTFEGRMIGIVLTLLGMGLFSLITAGLASSFLQASQRENMRKNGHTGSGDNCDSE